MAKPTAVTEFGTAKVMLLADSTVTTPGAYAPAAVAGGTSSEATYPVGWMGVATHRRGDAIGSPGGFTPGSAPVSVGAGYDNSAAGTVRAFRTDENGVQIVQVRPAIDLPLQFATATISAANVDTGVALADSTRFQYLQRLDLVCIGTVVGGSAHQAGSWSIKNGTAGTILGIWANKLNPAVGDKITLEFPNPLKTNVAGGSFVVNQSSTFLGTWQMWGQGFRSVV